LWGDPKIGQRHRCATPRALGSCAFHLFLCLIKIDPWRLP
jgi:hypothetical protein